LLILLRLFFLDNMVAVDWTFVSQIVGKAPKCLYIIGEV